MLLLYVTVVADLSVTVLADSTVGAEMLSIGGHMLACRFSFCNAGMCSTVYVPHNNICMPILPNIWIPEFTCTGKAAIFMYHAHSYAAVEYRVKHDNL